MKRENLLAILTLAESTVSSTIANLREQIKTDMLDTTVLQDVTYYALVDTVNTDGTIIYVSLTMNKSKGHSLSGTEINFHLDYPDRLIVETATQLVGQQSL